MKKNQTWTFFALGVAALSVTATAYSEGLRPGGSTATVPGAAASAAAPSDRVTYVKDVLPIFMGKCARCHNDQAKFLYNWMDYKTARADRAEIKRRVWDSWKGEYYKQPMPAGNSPECQAITEEERQTIREWVEAGAPFGHPGNPPNPKSKEERLESGKKLYATICAACHQPNGQGLPNQFPPLADSDFLNADKSRAIRTLIHGRQGEIVVNGKKFNNSMPSFPFSDEDIANALTFVYSSFGNSGKVVTAQEVQALRAEKEDPNEAKQMVAAPPREASPFE
jgi:mono/diheme cytochrome c family protein